MRGVQQCGRGFASIVAYEMHAGRAILPLFAGGGKGYVPRRGDNSGRGSSAMWRLIAISALVFMGAGCAADGQKHWYDDALKDARGDNMVMRSDR